MQIKSGSPADIAKVIDAYEIDDPEEVAFLIDVDGRARIKAGHTISLDDYLWPLHRFTNHSVVMDAAIDMTLKSLTHNGRPLEDASRELSAAFPQYNEQIESAVALSEALWKTTDVHVPPIHSERSLPCMFGPKMDNGECRFVLEDEIARGSSGVVYRALDRALSDNDVPATVAIKVFPFQRRSREESLEYADEAKKGRRVSHPYVASVIDLGRSDDREDYIVYEHVSGKQLDLSRNSVPHVRALVELVARIADGVQAIHLAGLAHCDLKPSNILIRDDGTPKIIDLGIAARSHEWHHGAAPHAQALGTLAFMSPQQYRGEALGHAPPSDIWALGGILYWLLTDQLPSGQTVEDAQRSLELGLNLRTWQSSSGRLIPSDLRMILEKALAGNPEDRFSSASEFAESLRSWLAHKPLRWTKPSPVKVFMLWCRRRPAIATMSLVVLLASFIAVYSIAATIEEKQWRKTSLGFLEFLMASSAMAEDSNLVSKQLSVISLGEWFYGPSFFRDPPTERRFYEERLQLIRTKIADAHDSGRGDDLETLLWESGLALWLVHDHQWEEAIPLIDQAALQWESHLKENDSWFVLMNALRDAAIVDQLIQNKPARGSRTEWMNEITDTTARIESALPLVESNDGGALRLIVYDRLITLYGPKYLDDPDKKSDIENKNHKLRERAELS